MHHVDNLVISCMDFRFRPRIAEWIDNQLGGEADLVVLAGASKAIIDEESTQKVMLNQIRLSKELHSITTVHIIDHQDCGGYGGSGQFANAEDEAVMHEEKLHLAGEIISTHFPDLRIELYYIDFDVIRQLTH